MATQSTYKRPLAGKIALITGASRGIGAAIAENLAPKGATLILNYTSPSSELLTKELANKLEKEHHINTFIVQADLGDPLGPASLIKAASQHFTERFQLDIIINNAGVAPNNKLRDIKISDFDFAYRVNVLGPLLLIQAAQPYLPTDRSGRIINLSSVSSTAGFIGQSVYGGTKAALEAMTRTWARELVENCTVNAINPGPVKTAMWDSNTDEFMDNIRPFIQSTPLEKVREGIDDEDLVRNAEKAGGRPAYPSEIAGIVGMLCSSESSWCTGQVVSANGGMRMSG